MFKSVFGRLFWTNVLILMLVFLSVAAGLAVFVSDTASDRQYETVKKVSPTINNLTGYLQVENHNVRARNFYVENLKSWSNFLDSDIIIADLEGNVVETTNKAVDKIPDSYVKAIAKGGELRKTAKFGSFYDGKVMTVAFPIEYYGTQIGGMYVNTPMPEISKMTGSVIIWFLIAATLSMIIAFALIYHQWEKISASISRINTAALDIAAGNFDERVQVTSKDEIGQLASSFNFMAGSLQKLDDMRNRFISDISHELRTPMTSISGFVGGILDGTIPPDKQEYYLKIVLDESNRLKKLVTDMLEMSRMSSSEYKLNVSEFDFKELVSICLIGLEQKIEEKSLEPIVTFPEEKVMVCADRDAIQRVLINLIDNAVKFAYPNTNVEIKLWTDRKKAYFSVGNFGEGIEKEELPHVFDRFYKIDKSRTNKTKGAGLGLSFVKNIMLLHKQSIWVESHEAKEGSNVKFTTFSFGLELA